MKLLERLMKRVIRSRVTSCWVWPRSLSADGYGQIRIAGGREGAHCIFWLLHNGPIPDGMCVLHKCDVPNCVNPEHLFLGTKKDNWHDAMKKGRLPQVGKRKEACKYGHQFVEENLYIHPNGRRECKQCRARRRTEYEQRDSL